MSTVRQHHSATLLLNGKVLVAGGSDGSVFHNATLASAEIYDPAEGTWSAANSLGAGRYLHSATLLQNGKVLAAGGIGVGGVIASAEIYDPATGTWSPTDSLATARYQHTATLLPDGKVLAAGGVLGSGLSTDVAEIYDPAEGTWNATNSMGVARQGHTATLLPGGKVLVVGGMKLNLEILASAEIYDPLTGTWSNTGSMSESRRYHTATLLPDGTVLVTGGYGGNVFYPASSEIYHPATGTWSTTGSMTTPRFDHFATLLPDGTVLAAGGQDSSGTLSSIEIFDPAAGTWSAAGSLNSARRYQSATLLPDGKLLLAGGHNGAGVLSSAERYDRGLGFNASWRPVLDSASSASLGTALTLGGAGWRGYGLEEASGGASSSSPTNYPLVQFRRLDNGQQTWLPTQAFSSTQLTTLPLSGFAPGPAMTTVFVNGIPSLGKLIEVHWPSLHLAPVGSGEGTVSSAPAGIDCGPACQADFTLNTTVTLTATPLISSTFAGWSGACSGAGSCVVTMTADRVVTATFDLLTNTITPTSGAGGSISPNLPQSIDYGRALTFTLAPDIGYHIADLVVDSVSQGALESYTFWNVTTGHTISASFALDTFVITPTTGTGGGISPNTPQTIEYGSALTFTVTPETGYHITDLAVDDISQGALDTYTFWNITTNHSISASFAINTYVITPTTGTGGGISPNTPQTVEYGDALTFTVTPEANYHVQDIVVDGVSQGNLETYTFWNVSASHTISAAFAINTFIITPTAGAGGGINPGTPQSVEYGSALTFTVTPDTGYHIQDVGVDGVSQGALESYAFFNIAASHTISASFTPSLSGDSSLSALALSDGILAPAFAPATLSYTAQVSNSVISLSVTPTAGEAHAAIQVRVNGGSWNPVTSGSPSGALALNVGDNIVEVQVTAQDSTATTYTLTVTRQASGSHDSRLSALALSSGVLNPAFAPDTLDYTTAVSYSVDSLVFTPTASEAHAVLQLRSNGVAWQPLNSGAPSDPLPLIVGNTTLEIKVTAQDNITARTYTLAVARADRSQLVSLAPSSGSLAPPFNPAVSQYTLSVPSGTTSITLNLGPSVSGSKVEVRINGGSWITIPSGQQSPPLAVKGGSNTLEIRVTPPVQVRFGPLIRVPTTYTVLVQRPDPNLYYLPHLIVPGTAR
jgi:N-acetylneuraminic acid mutarotase